MSATRVVLVADLLALTLLALTLTGCPDTDVPVNEVAPGGFCSPAGATGRAGDGTKLTCVQRAGQDSPRWRKAKS